MNQITVFELMRLCYDAVKRGDGDKKIVISSDSEGNGFHGLYYGFAYVNNPVMDFITDNEEKSPENLIILG